MLIKALPLSHWLRRQIFTSCTMLIAYDGIGISAECCCFAQCLQAGAEEDCVTQCLQAGAEEHAYAMQDDR